LAGLNFLPIIDQKGRKDTPARKNLLDRLKAIGVGVDVDGKTMWMNAGTFRDSISPSASPKAQPKVPKNGLVFTDDAGKCWWRLTPIGGAVVTIEGVMMNTFNKELKLVNCRFNPSGDYGEVKVYSDTSNVATQHPLKPDTPKRVGVTWSLKKPPTDEGKNCGCDISFKDHIGGEHTFEVTCSYQPMFSLG
jgi:hypothetical protein